MNYGALRQLRTSGVICLDCLSAVERDAINASFCAAVERLRGVAFGYYKRRSDNPDDATDWLVSETYTYVIESVIAGRRSIPTKPADWLAVGKTIRHRYWASIAIVVDGGKVRFLCDGDKDLSTRLVADRLQLDDVAFTGQLIDYARRGIGRKVAPAWIVQTITHWITAPNLTYRERAAELGLSRETIKDREAKTKSAIRAGILWELVAFEV